MIIEKYIVRRQIGRATLVGLLIAAAALAIDVGTTGPYWAGRVGWRVVLLAQLCHLPLHFVMILPLSGLLAGALLIAGMARSGELESLSACAAHPLRLGSSLAAAGAVLLLCSALVSELIVPPCEAIAARLYDRQRSSSISGTRPRYDRWFTAPNGWLVQLRRSGSAEGGAARWLAVRLDGSHHLLTRMSGTLQSTPSAPRGRVRILRRSSAEASSRSSETALVDFLQNLKQPDNDLPAEALSVRGLLKRAWRKRAHGQSEYTEAVFLHGKLTVPLLNLVAGLVVWAIAIRRGRSGTAVLLASAITWSLVLWLLVAIGWQLAHAHVLTAAAGTWLPFGCAALLALGALDRARRHRGSFSA